MEVDTKKWRRSLFSYIWPILVLFSGVSSTLQKETEVPPTPRVVRVTPYIKSIRVSWSTPASESKVLVRGYEIGWSKRMQDEKKVEVGPDQHVFNIDSLHPASEYIITVRSFNNRGRSPPRYETAITREETLQGPITPMKPPVGLKTVVLSASTVVLTWTDTSLGTSQRIQDNRFYTIRYRVASSANTGRYRYLNVTDLNAHIDNLKPNTTYEFEVKVIKGRRQSGWSMKESNKTDEAAPGSWPRDLTLIPVPDDPMAVTLNWQPPAKPNGQITGYLVYYTTDDRNWVVEGVLGDELSAKLKNLTADTTYFMKVQARNSKGIGPMSETKVYHTPKVETTTTPATSERHDVLCETDTITAFIPEDLLPAGAELTWRDPNCTLASNSSHFLSTISHNQCGTSVSINTDSVVFENEILLSTKSNVSSTTVNTMVDFGNIPAVIPVKCVYPRKQMSMLSYQPIPSVVRFYEKNNGHLEIKMETYKTNQFRETLHGLPVRIRLQSDVYIRVSLEEHSSNIGLRLEKCIATKSPLPYDKDVYTLIENGCPVPSHVKILQSPSTEARFSFKAFEFVNNNTAPVYIHCEAVVCQAGSPDCATNCRNQLRQRRDLGHNRHSHLITTGPLVLETDKESNLQVSTILAGVFALVAVGAIIVAVVGWRRKPLANNVDKS